METSKEKYIRLERESGFKVGDKVKVVGDFNSYQFGWDNCACTDAINDDVTYTIEHIGSDRDYAHGIELRGDGGGDYISYPFFALERQLTEEEEERNTADIIASLGLEETKI